MRTCTHFDTCGGCRFQDIPYEEQLRLKEEKIRNLLLAHDVTASVKPINAFNQWGYRNKMEYTFWGDNNDIVLGLHSKKQKRTVFGIKECPIFSEEIGELLVGLCAFAKRHNYTSYNVFTHKGFLRHLIVRKAEFTNQVMLGIVTTNENELAVDDLMKTLEKLTVYPCIKSIYHIINDSFGDAITFQKRSLIYAEPYITEQIGDFSFRIDIDTFFQTNPYGIRSLYEKLATYAPVSKEHNVLDLFCGVGSISLFMAQKAKFVWGVEVNENAVKGAQLNAEHNNVTNTSFICDDVKTFLANNNLKGAIELAVINPPRSGLSKKIKRRLVRLGVPHLFYSSCNPASCVMDIKELHHDYTLEFIEPFDFFPHTPHMEVLAYLKKRPKSESAT